MQENENLLGKHSSVLPQEWCQNSQCDHNCMFLQGHQGERPQSCVEAVSSKETGMGGRMGSQFAFGRAAPFVLRLPPWVIGALEEANEVKSFLNAL